MGRRRLADAAHRPARGLPGWARAGLSGRPQVRQAEPIGPTPILVELHPGPMLLAQGTRDTVWASEMTRRLADRLRAHGRIPELHWYEGRDHGVRGDTFNLHWAQVIAFFRRHLGAGEPVTAPAVRGT